MYAKERKKQAKRRATIENYFCCRWTQCDTTRRSAMRLNAVQATKAIWRRKRGNRFATSTYSNTIPISISKNKASLCTRIPSATQCLKSHNLTEILLSTSKNDERTRYRRKKLICIYKDKNGGLILILLLPNQSFSNLYINTRWWSWKEKKKSTCALWKHAN